jgi:hypothetical protein
MATHSEDRRGAAELLADYADYDPALLRRALLGEAGSGSATRSNDLLTERCAKHSANKTRGFPVQNRWSGC